MTKTDPKEKKMKKEADEQVWVCREFRRVNYKQK